MHTDTHTHLLNKNVVTILCVSVEEGKGEETLQLWYLALMDASVDLPDSKCWPFRRTLDQCYCSPTQTLYVLCVCVGPYGSSSFPFLGIGCPYPYVFKSIGMMTKVIIVSFRYYLIVSSSAEGESEEAWLAEAGLTGLFDDSLTPDQDQVCINLLLC